MSSGNPCICYYDFETAELKYGQRTSSGWCFRTVDIVGIESEKGVYAISLALDDNNEPHISYCDGAKEELKYAYLAESGWIIETVDSEGDVGFYVSLSLESCGKAHIVYYDETNEKLKYAYLSNSGWHIETVDSDKYRLFPFHGFGRQR